MTLMQVNKVEFEPSELWRLSSMAEKKGLSVAELLSQLGKQLLVEPATQKWKPTPSPPIEPESGISSYEQLYVRVEQLYEMGLTDGEIAARIGRSPSWVQGARKRLGLLKRRGRRTREESALARNSLKQLSNAATAAEMKE